jgi:hypothetical protein
MNLKQTLTSRKNRDSLNDGSKFLEPQLLFFILIFALLGGYLLYRSFATNPNLLGDCNNDNVVNVTDLSLLLSNYNSTSNLSCDFNHDNVVSILDLSTLLSHYGQTYSVTYPPTSYSVHHYWVGIFGTNAFNFPTDSSKMDDFIAHAPDSWGTQGAPFKQYQPHGHVVFYQEFGVAGDGISTTLSETIARSSGYLAHHNGAEILNPWGGTNKVVDLGKAGVAAAYVSSIESHYQNNSWDGIFADDVNAWYNLWSNGQSIDGYTSPDDYWTRAVVPLMQYVYAHLKADKNAVVIPNIGDWALHTNLNSIISNTDGGNNEYYLMWNGAGVQDPATIENEYSEMQTVINAGKTYYGIVHRTDLQGLRFAFCAAAIMGGDHANQVRISNQVNYGSDPLAWDVSLQTALGTPTNGVSHTTGSTTWSRSFSGGQTLIINTGTQTCSGI